MADSADNILKLVRAANAGLASVAEGTTANEVFSAYFTMASHAIETAKEMGVPAEALQNIVYAMLVRCDDPKMRVM